MSPCVLSKLKPMARRLMPNSVRSQAVTSPTGPSVAIKAKASGTPAKLDATPENVSSGERTCLGSPPNVMAADIAKPIRQPSTAEKKLTRIESR